MSLRASWDNLSPNAKRAAALGGSLFVVVAVGAGSFIVAPPQSQGPQSQSPRDTLVRNILTDVDPRALGMDALVNRLERMETRMGDLRQQMEKDARNAPPAPAQTGAEREQALDRSVEVESLRQEVAQLRDALAAASAAKPLPTTPPGLLATPAPPAPPAKAATNRYGPAPLEELFAAPSEPIQGPARSPGAAPGQGGATTNRTLQIRTFVAPEQPKSDTADTPVKVGEGEVYVPAGAIIKGVFLNGLDMPTGQGARKDPTPALIRVKHRAILPNRVRADVRECFLLVSGFGDLASERAQLRGETFSCVRTDGGIIEIPMDGYAVGEDGKVGVRGRVVSKQGALLAKALQAGFLQSFAALFNAQPAIPVAPVTPNTSSQLQYQSVFTPQALGAAAAQGVGGAMDRLANYYRD
jgi:conjugal transfer pilus assembly protein TraB